MLFRSKNAVKELRDALAAFTGRDPQVNALSERKEGAGQIESICLVKKEGCRAEGYCLYEEKGGIVVEASDERGILYGVFALIFRMQRQEALAGLNLKKEPVMPLRMVNHWDNMDGSIERGYSGRSFFFDNNEILVDERTVTYARLMASVGINGAVINNVNVKDQATYMITEKYFDRLREMSEIFAGYGIRFFMST